MRVEATVRLPYVDTGTLDGLFPWFLIELEFVQPVHPEGCLPGIRHRHYACSSQVDLREYDDRLECL